MDVARDRCAAGRLGRFCWRTPTEDQLDGQHAGQQPASALVAAGVVVGPEEFIGTTLTPGTPVGGGRDHQPVTDSRSRRALRRSRSVASVNRPRSDRDTGGPPCASACAGCGKRGAGLLERRIHQAEQFRILMARATPRVGGTDTSERAWTAIATWAGAVSGASVPETRPPPGGNCVRHVGEGFRGWGRGGHGSGGTWPGAANAVRSRALSARYCRLTMPTRSAVGSARDCKLRARGCLPRRRVLESAAVFADLLGLGPSRVYFGFGTR